jgi:hypothetical protein
MPARPASHCPQASAIKRTPRAKPVPPLAHEFARLICPLHRSTPYSRCASARYRKARYITTAWFPLSERPRRARDFRISGRHQKNSRETPSRQRSAKLTALLVDARPASPARARDHQKNRRESLTDGRPSSGHRACPRRSFDRHDEYQDTTSRRRSGSEFGGVIEAMHGESQFVAWGRTSPEKPGQPVGGSRICRRRAARGLLHELTRDREGTGACVRSKGPALRGRGRLRLGSSTASVSNAVEGSRFLQFETAEATGNGETARPSQTQHFV